jgi:hypothetical protein
VKQEFLIRSIDYTKSAGKTKDLSEKTLETNKLFKTSFLIIFNTILIFVSKKRKKDCALKIWFVIGSKIKKIQMN